MRVKVTSKDFSYALHLLIHVLQIPFVESLRVLSMRGNLSYRLALRYGIFEE